MSVRVVQGFGVVSFTVRNDEVKVVLSGCKDDIRAGDGDIADVLESLELHSTAADTSTISVALRNSEDAEQSTSYEFVVLSFAVKQDKIRLVLETLTSDVGMAVLGALGTHSAAEEDQRLVELTMQRPE
jgi:hypothetical protein